VALSDSTPHASGGFADIWKGELDGNRVCVKSFRTQAVENTEKFKRVRGSSLSTRGWAQPDFNQRFYREIVAWKYLSHSNVLPLLGASEMLFSFSIISPWLPNGNIIEYIKKTQGVNRLQLVSDPYHLRRQTIQDFVLGSLRKLPVVSSMYIH